MDLGGHQCGILELTCRTVFAPFERGFGMKIVDCQCEDQKNKKESDVEWFFVWPSHRIPSSTNIREIRRECQMLSMIHFLGTQNPVCDRDERFKAGF